MIGAVVPVCNRRDNLELLLESLGRQTYRDFELVVADDGSTDGTRELVDRYRRTDHWTGRLKWIGCGPNRGVRTGRARNIGASNLASGIDFLVMLDSDLILPRGAMAGFAAVHARHPRHILLGQVDWLPPLDRTAALAAIDKDGIEDLRNQVPASQPTRIEGTFTGPELRVGLHDLDPEDAIPLRPEWALPLNSGWPMDLYWNVGGFDESMCGYGYQDMEFGARAAKAGARCLPRPDLWGLHVWHPKPPRAMVENQRNLDFYLRRHGSNSIIENDVDWTLWWHYHAERDGRVVVSRGQLWAINGTRDRRLALPNAAWLRRLGHCEHDVDEIPYGELGNMENFGDAQL
jgi:glycosyltransferase involved in cell wall biosynthesis